MSRISFAARLPDDQPVTVTVGWDRPMRTFFLQVPNPHAGADDELMLYDSTYDPVTQFDRLTTIDFIQAKLADLAITPPAALAPTLHDHRSRNAGNELITLR